MSGVRQTKRSCPFCQSEDRDELEKGVHDGTVNVKQLDMDKGWRANTGERHMRNHVGEYQEAANYSCVVCTYDDRSTLEVAYFEGDRTTEDIATELDCSEPIVYRHMKMHFQPLVKKASTAVVAVKVGQEVEILRDNVQGLNGKLAQFMEETNIHDDGVISDMVRLHKEVRETLKDLAVWMERTDNVEKQQSVSIVEVLQNVFSEKAPEEWREMREALAKAGVLE